MQATLNRDSLARLPKADLIEFVIALAAPVPAPVDADVPAPTPAPEAKPDKAEREVPCNVHAADVCTRKFWTSKGANDERHVARLS